VVCDPDKLVIDFTTKKRDNSQSGGHSSSYIVTILGSGWLATVIHAAGERKGGNYRGNLTLNIINSPVHQDIDSITPDPIHLL